MQLELSDKEADSLDDILGMWLEGIEEELPKLKEPDAESHWATHELRKQRERAQTLRLRIQLSRRDA